MYAPNYLVTVVWSVGLSSPDDDGGVGGHLLGRSIFVGKLGPPHLTFPFLSSTFHDWPPAPPPAGAGGQCSLWNIYFSLAFYSPNPDCFYSADNQAS